MVLENFFDWLFAPFLKLGDGWSIVTISIVLTLVTTIIYKLVTNQELMKELKSEMNSFREKMKQLKDQPEKLMEAQGKAMKKQFEYMKHSMKATMITFIPLILIFTWLRSRFGEAGDVFIWGFNIPLFGDGLGWLGTYFFSALISSLIIRKLLKVH